MGAVLSRNQVDSSNSNVDACPVCLSDFNEGGGAEIMHGSFGQNAELHKVCRNCVSELIRSVSNEALRCPICQIPADKNLLSASLRSALNAVYQRRRDMLSNTTSGSSALQTPANIHLLTTNEAIQMFDQHPELIPRLPPELVTPEIAELRSNMRQQISRISELNERAMAAQRYPGEPFDRATRDQMIELTTEFLSSSTELAALCSSHRR